MKLAVRKIGNSFGVILTKQLMERLHVKAGDTLYAVEHEEGITLSSYDPEFEEAMEAYDKFSKKYRNALHKLAK